VGGEGFTPPFPGSSPTFGSLGHNACDLHENMKEGGKGERIL
jgi:hypothetical protein